MDKKRWFGGLVRCQKSATDNLHNHKLHAANRIAQCIKERIGAAVSSGVGRISEKGGLNYTRAKILTTPPR